LVNADAPETSRFAARAAAYSPHSVEKIGQSNCQIIMFEPK
jgi:hypothetical protein